MSLKQKYTWNDFKREQGEKAKGLKRTSAEGQKAFEAARKAKIKGFVEERLSRYEKQRKGAQEAVEEYTKGLKGLKSTEKRARILQRLHRRKRAIRKFEQVIARDQARTL